MASAVKARHALGRSTGTFPRSSPARELLEAATVYEDIPHMASWDVQVFIRGSRRKGCVEHEICFTSVVEEVVAYMSDRKMMQIRISDDLHKWLKMYATKNDTTMTNVVISYLTRLRERAAGSVKVDQI
jgi:hypothetical protein